MGRSDGGGATVSVDMFHGLPPDEVEALVAACKRGHYEPGQAVFVEGDSDDDLYIVKSGRIRISKAISQDTDRTLAVVERGGVFGELALVGASSRSATASALEPTEVLALTRDGFGGLADRSPQLGLKVMGKLATVLAERLQTTTDLLRDTVNWSLEVSGAAQLDLHHVIQARASVEVALTNGDRLKGQILKVEQTAGGVIVTLAGDGDALHLLPWHAVMSLRLSRAQVLGAEVA
jgi:CRP/FNR family cyclic AMP-dependent transcriptional regulator